MRKKIKIKMRNQGRDKLQALVQVKDELQSSKNDGSYSRKRQCLSIILKPINNAAEMNLSTASNDYNEVNNLKKK